MSVLRRFQDLPKHTFVLPGIPIATNFISELIRDQRLHIKGFTREKLLPSRETCGSVELVRPIVRLSDYPIIRLSDSPIFQGAE